MDFAPYIVSTDVVWIECRKHSWTCT